MPEDAVLRWTRIWRAARDPLTWALGAGLLIYETWIRHGEDQGLLVVIGGLIGLPVVVRYEERREHEHERSLPPETTGPHGP